MLRVDASVDITMFVRCGDAQPPPSIFILKATQNVYSDSSDPGIVVKYMDRQVLLGGALRVSSDCMTAKSYLLVLVSSVSFIISLYARIPSYPLSANTISP